ncbi:MAG: hypothetical protein WCR48_05365 [Bacteroidales bacterium]
MRFEDIAGNSEVKKALAGMVDGGRIPNAIMLYEDDGCGALAIALAFLQYLYCKDRKDGDSCGVCDVCNRMSKLIHPDVNFIFPVTGGSKVSAADKPTSESYLQWWRELVLSNPYFLENELSTALGIEGKSSMIAVSESKSLLDKLSLSSVEGGYKSVVLYLPEKMNAEAANRLLKIVEEPPEKTVFIMITHSPEKVIRTISSRCQSIRVLPLTRAEIEEALIGSFGKSAEDAASASAMADGSVGAALRYVADKSDYQTDYDLFADLVNSLLKRDFLSSLESAEVMAAMDSREKQKAFCKFAVECLRKIFLLQQRLPQLAQISVEQSAFYENAASKCKKSFPRNAMAILDRTTMMLDRNVNQKILFCDMVNRLYLNI